jgi:hypothetical protein
MMRSIREGGMDRPARTKSHPAESLYPRPARRAAVSAQSSSLRPYSVGQYLIMRRVDSANRLDTKMLKTFFNISL